MMIHAYLSLLTFLLIAVVLCILLCCPVLWQSLLLVVGVVSITIISVLIGLNYQGSD